MRSNAEMIGQYFSAGIPEGVPTVTATSPIDQEHFAHVQALLPMFSRFVRMEVLPVDTAQEFAAAAKEYIQTMWERTSDRRISTKVFADHYKADFVHQVAVTGFLPVRMTRVAHPAGLRAVYCLRALAFMGQAAEYMDSFLPYESYPPLEITEQFMKYNTSSN